MNPISTKPTLTEDQAARIGAQSTTHQTLRNAGPLVEVEAPAGGPAWIITDDALARQVLTDERFAKDPALAPPHWHGLEAALEPPASQVRSLTTLDGAEHRRLRGVHAPAFTRRRILAGRDRATTIARDLLTELANQSAQTGRPADLVSQFASHYPMMVICDLLGAPLTDLTTATRASDAMIHGNPEQALAAMAKLETMVAAAIRTRHDTETMTDVLAQRARSELVDVTDDELLYMITGLIFAGQVTTESFLGFLLAHYLVTGGSAPDRDIDALITEVLRLHPPAPFTLWRFTTAAVDLAGVTLPRGAPVLVDIEGINTDPTRHQDPLSLDPNRPRLPDLTFGDGPHTCIGAQLAQLEARVVIDVLHTDFPAARLAVPFQTLERDTSGYQLRRLRSLPAWLRHSRE